MNNKNERKIKRGDIYLYDFGDNEGSIQCGYSCLLYTSDAADEL